MPKYGKFDYKSFKKFADKFDDIEKISDEVLIDILKEAGSRVLRKTIKRTPVGVYTDHTGGNLRRNWHVTNVIKDGNGLLINIYTNVEYAPFVEYGHRKRNNKGWVEGKYMLTISMKEVEALLPKISDKHIRKALRGIFND